MSAVSLVVMEVGSEWPSGLDGDILAVGNDDASLLLGTRQGLASLRRRRQHVAVGVLACSEATHVEAAETRIPILLELILAVSERPVGLVVISAGHAASPQLRRALVSLADDLVPHMQQVAASVVVRFNRPTLRTAASRAARTRSEHHDRTLGDTASALAKK